MTEAARPLRATRRLTALQSKENPVMAQKNVLTKQSTTVRATLGEISNRAPSLLNQVDKAGVLKKQTLVPSGKATFNVNPYAKNFAAKENVPVEKPKGLAVKQDKNVVIGKPVARTSVSSKPLVTGKPAAGVLKRVSSLVGSKSSGLSVHNVNKPKSSVIPSATSKPKSNEVASKPRLVTVKEKTLEVKEPETAKQIQIKPDVKVAPAALDLLGFSTEQLNKLEEIDTRDKIDPQQVIDYVRDIYEYMKELEVTYCVPKDYIKQSKYMTYNMRAVLMDWLVEVHRQFKLMPETLYLAVAIFDRYMPLAPNTSKQQLQLVGIVCMLVASKYEEIMCPTVGDCTYITDNTYTKKQVMEMEMKILGALNFNVGRPLPLHFLRRYTKGADANYEDHNMAKYFLELMLVRHEMCHVAPSLQAAAALCLALWVNNEQADQPLQEVWNYALQYFSGYSFAQVEEVVKLLVTVVVKGHKSSLTAVRKKYASKTHMEISNIVEGALPRISTLFL